ncbi:HAD-IC family P-type ATPase [Leptolyngbya sp. FACHB-711]|uniref:HAD-IC family P-type ATPase n=1 Tax=unclassified Leptolyngbya TaxID=2650499 RepID=UPI00168210F5|nr:HAD-IC family P-type ATPase [Leptolyngbya sp. FACHB-711]MBD2025587.1 HAD-IC family P-type ATPase [Leptolyngbya sp. FACHB-711]
MTALPDRPTPDSEPSLQGLTQQEVIARRAAGQGNVAPLKTSRSYSQILRENLFTVINFIFFAISLVMFLLQRVGDGILVVVVIFGGVLVSIYQEIWAKRQLDRIALLNRPQATVIREGQESEIDPSEIVLGDILIARPGDQLVVDGAIVGTGRMEVDESLLTGESDLIPKQKNALVYSGSFCVSGTACYEAQKVGSETLAYRLMAEARAFRRRFTPLQVEINVVIRVFMLIACFLWVLVGISFLSSRYSLNEIVQRFAVIAGLVPAGLLLAITLAYGLGAVRMVGQDVLIQQANAVESLSNVDTLCLDKTGTLTTNQIQLEEVYPVASSLGEGISADQGSEGGIAPPNKAEPDKAELDKAEIVAQLADYAASVTAGNRTSEAIALAYPGKTRLLKAELPFSSARKWSAIALDDEMRRGIYVLGAPEALSRYLTLTGEMLDFIQSGAEQGLRVVLFAYYPDPTLLSADVAELPIGLQPLALLRFSDRLRPEAYETLEGFARAGIEVKIISGDNPHTVAALAKQAGLREIRSVSGAQLAELDEAQFAQAAREGTVFGRVTPEQKALLVKHLRQSGRYVAMIGDGVNDVLSLKQADLAIAMESGSKATRGVADIVLLKDSFGALPRAFREGQCIRNGIQDVLKLFLVRTFCVTLLIFATAIVTESFPLQNKQSAIVALIGVGFPTMFLPIWAKPGLLPRRSMVRSMLHFVIPSTLTLTLVSLLVYLFYLVVAVLNLPPGSDLTQVNYAIPRSALVTILIMGQLLLLPFLKPPNRAWVGGEPLSRDWRYSIVSGVLLIGYFLIVSIPSLSRFFELYPLGAVNYLFIGLVAIEWCFILRSIWRSRFFDRFLGIDLS